jgi:hypothetical protein
MEIKDEYQLAQLMYQPIGKEKKVNNGALRYEPFFDAIKRCFVAFNSSLKYLKIPQKCS